MDVDKLTPAPWHNTEERLAFLHSSENGFPVYGSIDGTYPRVANVRCSAGQQYDAANAEFIALARNAFDVMMRRKWTVFPKEVQGPKRLLWFVEGDGVPKLYFAASDPFTALIRADEWFSEREKT